MTARAAVEGHGERTAACLARRDLFRPWEVSFLEAMQRRLRPTRRQASIVRSLYDRAAGAPPAGA